LPGCILHYQPQVDLASGSVVGIEAQGYLLRIHCRPIELLAIWVPIPADVRRGAAVRTWRGAVSLCGPHV